MEDADLETLNEPPRITMTDEETGAVYLLHSRWELSEEQATNFIRLFQLTHPEKQPRRGQSISLPVPRDGLDVEETLRVIRGY